VKVIFAGTPETAIPTLKLLVESEHQVVAVVTREDAPFGRKGILTASPIAQLAHELNIPTIKANRFTDEIVDQIIQLEAEVGVVVAFGAFLPERALTAVSSGWLNLHFSDLPRLRGAAPVQWTLIQGDTQAATCVFKLVTEMDAGPIASTQFTALDGSETTTELLGTLATSGARQVLSVIEQINHGTVVFTNQQGEATFARKLDSLASMLDPALSATVNFNRFRGVTREPGAWIYDGESRLKIHRARISPYVVDSGAIVSVDGEVLWGTSTTALELVEVQPAGRQKMSAQDWARGRR
jgi:methionyl-tRNA formyltransferase